MKFNRHVSSSKRKARRRLFNAPSHIRRQIMSVALSKELCREYGVPRLTVPIHRDDTVKVVRGKYKDEAPSKVIRVHRTRYRLYIDNVQREKANGSQVKVPVHYSNCVITKLKLDSFRKKLLKTKVRRKLAARRKLGLDPSGMKETEEKKVEAEEQPDLD